MAPEREEESLAPNEVAARYVAYLDWYDSDRRDTSPGRQALSILEEWIDTDPERAWPVFLELVRLRPGDDEVLERVWRDLRFLLQRHGAAFHARVVALVTGNARLRRIAPAHELEPGALRPKPLDVPELVQAYITHSVAHEDAQELDRMIRDDPDEALPLILEIISRGPLHGLTTSDTHMPLEHLLREHGRAVIDRVEEAAAESVLVRRCLGERVHDIVRNDPELAWRLVNLLVEAAPSDQVLESVAAGPLEDLLREHGSLFVDRVEERARQNERFRQCLAGVWMSRGELPDDVLQRIVDASGGEIEPSDPLPGEGEWLREQRMWVRDYLSRRGIDHGGVAGEPAWSMEFYATLWSVGSPIAPARVGGWVIVGPASTPTTYVPSDDAPDARTALRVISAQWLEAAEYMDRGQPHPDVELDPPDRWPEFVPFLRSLARMFDRIAEDDGEWTVEP